jgi:hypothetical protein
MEELTVRTMRTYEDLERLTIAQDDDCDYDESGYVVVYDGKEAAIGRYGHCSCFGTASALRCKTTGILIYDWYGTVEELLKMARYKLDPHYTLGSRKADKNDCDYDHLIKCYAQVLKWNRNRNKA